MSPLVIRKSFKRWAGKETGSLTVEACIIFPVFLFFLLSLLLGVQLACITMALDHGVSETAKQLAASSYPLSLLSEGEDELAPGEQSSANELLEHVLAGITYRELHGQGKYRIAQELLEQYLRGSLVNEELLILRQVELPVCGTEYELGTDNNRDDVVIQVEYHFRAPLPFVKKPLVLRHMAVERAWLYGGNGVYTCREEKGIFSQDNNGRIVYVTRTGTKYHRSDCRYLKKSKIPILLQEASKKYQPCKVCGGNEK